MNHSSDIYDKLSIALLNGNGKDLSDIFFKIEYSNLIKNQVDEELIYIIFFTLNQAENFAEISVEKMVLFVGSDFNKFTKEQSVELLNLFVKLSRKDLNTRLKIIIGDLIGHRYPVGMALDFCKILIENVNLEKNHQRGIISILSAVCLWLKEKEAEFSKSQFTSYKRIMKFVQL